MLCSRAEARGWRGRPQVDVVDVLKESFRDERVKCFSARGFVERIEAAGLWKCQCDSGVILELAADLSEQASL
jgi:hypothetical protein